MSKITILDQVDTGKLIRKIGQTGKALQGQIHQAAVSCLVHMRDHGDNTLAIRLLEALPTGQRVKALANWFRVFSGEAVSFTFDSKEQAWAGKFAKRWTADQFEVEKAMETTYGDLVPEKGYDTLSANALVAMLKRKANEDGKHPNGQPKVSDAARALAQQLYVAAKANLLGSTPVEMEEQELPEGQTA